MRTISSTLLAAQQAALRRPYLKATARNTLGGAVKLLFPQLYTGAESENQHALTLPADGSLVRVRITPAADSRRLYRQRVTSPGPGSDFSQWTYHASQYGILAAAVCSLGSEVSLAWIRSNGEIRRIKSTDNGATWPVTDYPGYAPSSYVTGLAAAYKPNGDLALFFTEAQAIFVVLNLNGVWQNRLAWNKSTGDLSGVAAVYAGGDWKLIVTGKDADGNFKVWSLIYGDGGEAAAGSWTELKTLATAPADGDYSYSRPFLAKPDIYRVSFLETFAGTEAYARPFLSHSIPGTSFLDGRWREPVPFENESLDGLALGESAGRLWSGGAAGLWRAELAEQTLELTDDVISLRMDLSPGSGWAALEMDNSSRKYNSIAGSLLEDGNEILVSPGYRGSAGSECSEGLYFVIQGYEHTSGRGKSSMLLYAADGWNALENWTARHQFRWNRPDQYGDPTQEASVKEILTQVLARAGLKLEVVSESLPIGNYYPDFTVHAGDSGKAIVRRLLSFVPDMLIAEGGSMILANPLAGDSADYEYGPDHVILEGRYRSNAWKINRVKIEGLNVIQDTFSWEEVRKHGDRLRLLEDRNLRTAAEAGDRGAAILREEELEAVTGMIRVPVNCGQQLYDVIEITDLPAGLNAARRRVLEISLTYQPFRAEYEQKLTLGGV